MNTTYNFINLREKLIDMLLDCDRAFDVLECFNERPRKITAASIIADYLISNSVTVQGWFPVSEPSKERGMYLCYYKFEPESPDVICENTYRGSGYWMSESDKVTHWTYLPEPPKGD